MPRKYIFIDNMGEVSPRVSNMARIDALCKAIELEETMHTELHPQAGQVVKIEARAHPDLRGPQEFLVEDWWDRLTGGSWMDAEGNPACLIYAMRSGLASLPLDNDVIYGHVGPFGHLVHASEIVG